MGGNNKNLKEFSSLKFVLYFNKAKLEVRTLELSNMYVVYTRKDRKNSKGLIGIEKVVALHINIGE